MGLREIMERNPNLTLEDMQEIQKEYDKRFVDSKFKSRDGKVQHTLAHMAKAMGRLAEYVERMEEGKEISPEDIKTKVIPDLLVYSAWLANAYGVRMDRAYLTRIVGNLKRLYSDKIPARELNALEKQVRGKFGARSS